MTEPIHDRNEQPDAEETPPAEMIESHGGLAVPPPVPQKKPGFLRRLFTTRKQQQAVAVQNGYLEMVDLIRAIRSHLDRQETVQTRVLSMLEKVPDAMDRQHEVMSLFKQQLESNIINDQRLTDSMGRLSGTLDAMNDSQKTSSRTITDLITRSRESEQLLREVMRRAERRMTLLIAFFVLLVIGMGFYLVHWQNRGARLPAPAAESPAVPAPAEDALADPEPPAALVVAEEPPAAPEEPDAEALDAEAPATDAAVEADEAPETIAPPPVEPESEPALAPPAAMEDKPTAKPRDRRRTRAEPKPEPVAEETPAPEAAPAPAEESSPAAEPDPEPTPEPMPEVLPETIPLADEKQDPAPKPTLFQLEAAIGEAVVDAFAPRRAPVSLP